MRTASISVAVLIAAVLTALTFASPQAQQRPPAEPLPDIKDTPAARFIGTWKGTATHQRGPGAEPESVEVTEKAEWKLGESAIYIEGRGTMKNADTGEETVVHDALGIVRYDPRSRKLMFHGFKTGEPANESELEILDDGDMRWIMKPAPNATVRFTIHITNDTWTEIGEFSRDGGISYMPFMEMNLKRVK